MNLPKIATFIICAILGYSALIAYAYHTQEVVYAKDLPPTIVCIKDEIPDAYLCVPDEDIPWYLKLRNNRTEIHRHVHNY